MGAGGDGKKTGTALGPEGHVRCPSYSRGGDFRVGDGDLAQGTADQGERVDVSKVFFQQDEASTAFEAESSAEFGQLPTHRHCGRRPQPENCGMK